MRAIQQLVKAGIAQKQIRTHLDKMTAEEMLALVASSQASPASTAPPPSHPPPPAPTYPFAQWELVTLLDGMFLLVNPNRGPAIRRIAGEICRFYGAVNRSEAQAEFPAKCCSEAPALWV